MHLIDILKNKTVNINKYRTHSEAVIITCFYNPTNSPYRSEAFKIFYDSIKHLNHRVIECLFEDQKSELKDFVKNLSIVTTNTVLWHKESLLNHLIKKLPSKYKYVFWVDADVLFTNKNWLVESVESLQYYNMIQPFEYCVHLEPGQTEPNFNVETQFVFDGISQILKEKNKNRKVWKSFCYNQLINPETDGSSENYDKHGHVGFAWGIKREILNDIDLYDKALIGGADHIMAHASVGQIPHSCITKSFTDDIEAVNDWSTKFYDKIEGLVTYTPGNLYHIWHGDLKKREYLKRVKEFTSKSKTITDKDENGLYITEDDVYVKEYFKKRDIVFDIIRDSVFDYIPTNITNDTVDQNEPHSVGNGGGFDGGGADGSWSDSENFS